MIRNIVPMTQDDEVKADWSEYFILSDRILKRYHDAMLRGKPREALHLSLELIEMAHKLKSGALDQI